MKIIKCLIIATCAIALASCGGKKSGGMSSDNEFPVRTIESSDASTSTVYPATVKGIQDVQIRPKVSGFITRVCVQEGQTVSAGQLLFTIDSEVYAAAVRQCQAALNTAKVQMNTAKLTYENNKRLFDNNVIGQYELSTAQNSYESAKAQVAQATAALTSAKEQLSYCSVTSPAAGVVGSLPFKVGALVSASSAEPLTTVSDITTMEVFFSMTEKDVLEMTKTSGNVTAAISHMPEVKLQLADGSIYNHPGKVVKMSGVIDATTGSISAIAHFTNPDKLLRSGASGSIVIPHDNSNAIVVPMNATVEVQNKIFVYVLGKDNKVKYTEITVDPQNDGLNYIVTSGLHVGDRYVTNGITKLSDQMEIKPITDAEYANKIAEAEKMGEAQGSASAFAKTMQGK